MIGWDEELASNRHITACSSFSSSASPLPSSESNSSQDQLRLNCSSHTSSRAKEGVLHRAVHRKVTVSPDMVHDLLDKLESIAADVEGFT